MSVPRRFLGNLSVCPIGFGTWGLGGVQEGAPDAYGPTDDCQSILALRRSLELGVNFFDTAGLYGRGHAEKLLGKLGLGAHYVATKAGYTNAAGEQNFSYDYLRSEIEQSLRRLQRGRLDLFQLHDPDPQLFAGPLPDTLRKLRGAALFDHLGVSVRSPRDALEVLGRAHVDSIQLNLSLVDQRAVDDGVLARCEEAGVAVLARTPLCFGFLTARIEDQFPPGDHRRRWSMARRQAWIRVRDRMLEVAPARFSGQPVQLALAFCLAFPQIALTIPGMLTPSQVEENLAVLDLEPMTTSERDGLRSIYSEFRELLASP